MATRSVDALASFANSPFIVESMLQRPFLGVLFVGITDARKSLVEVFTDLPDTKASEDSAPERSPV